MHVALSLALVAFLSSPGEMGLVVLENQTTQPFVYQFYYGYDAGKQDPWTRSLTIPAGQRRTILTPVPLVIGLRDGSQWKTHTLPPGMTFRFKSDAQGHAGLFLASGPSPPPQNMREIKVLAVADIEYRNRFPEWQDRLRRLIASASRFYESEFGIRLVPFGYRPWEFNARYQASMDEKLASLTKIDLGEADIAIAFIRSVRAAPGQMLLGWSLRFSEYVVVADTWPELAELLPLPHREDIWKLPDFGSTVVLIHELGHTLGAFHLDDLNSIMCPQPHKMIPPRIQFDDYNREVILASRDVDFRRGPDSISRQAALRIRALYQQHHMAAEPVQWDPITSAYRYRAALAQISNNRPLAAQMTRRADTWWRDPPATGATADATLRGRPSLPPPTARPTFSATSIEPVSLRYRFAAGGTFVLQADTRSLGELETPGDSRLAGGSTLIEARGEVKWLDSEGNAGIEMTATRAVAHGMRPDEPSFDSQQKRQPREPRFVALASIVGRPLSATVSPAGRILKIDSRPLADDVRKRGGELALGYLAAAVDLMVKNAFVRLADAPAKIGDVYPWGDQLTKLPDGGLVRTASALRLAAVSGDRKMALLEIVPRTSERTPGKEQPQVTVERAGVEGWVLFDLEKGGVARSFRRVAWSGRLLQGDRSAKINEAIDTNFSAMP